MRRLHRLGLGFGLAAAGGFATLAPSPHVREVMNGECPIVRTTDLPREGVTPATGTMDGLAAYVLNTLRTRCEDGKTTIETSGRNVTYSFVRNVGRAGLTSTYELSVEAKLDDSGAIGMNDVSAFTIREDVSVHNKGGTLAGVEAYRLDDNWKVSVTEPHDDVPPIVFSGNTGGSIATHVASDTAKLGMGIIDDALEGDWIGDQHLGMAR